MSTAGPVRLAWRVRMEDAPGRGGPVTLEAPAELAPYLAALLPDYRVEAPRIGDDLRVTGRGADGYRLESPANGALATGDTRTVVVAAELAVARTLLGGASGIRVLHASGVRPEQAEAADGEAASAGPAGAVLFSGPGGAGKSTLAAALARRGVPVLGDDVVLVDVTGSSVAPFRRLFKVPHDSVRRLDLPPPPPTPLDDLSADARFYRPEELGSRWAGRGPVRAVLFPRRTPGARPTLRALPPAEAVRRLLGQALLVPRADVRDFEAAAGLVEGARVAELIYGDAAEVADAVADGSLSGA